MYSLLVNMIVCYYKMYYYDHWIYTTLTSTSIHNIDSKIW